MTINGTALSSIEQRLNTLVTETTSGVGGLTAFIPANKTVLVTSVEYVSDTLGHLLVVEDAAGSNRWEVVMRVADFAQHIQFDHPLVLDGLGIQVTGGSGRWSVAYQIVKG